MGKNAVFCSKVHGMKINQQLDLIEQTRLGSCIDRTEMRLMQIALLLHNPSSLKYFESTIFTGTKKKDKETTLTRKFVDAFKVPCSALRHEMSSTSKLPLSLSLTTTTTSLFDVDGSNCRQLKKKVRNVGW